MSKNDQGVSTCADIERQMAIWHDMAMANPDEDGRRQLRDASRRGERERFRRSLPITVAELEELVEWVRSQLIENGCDHTTRTAQRWAAVHANEWPPLESALNEQGGYCDCEIVYNCDPRHLFG